MTKHKIVPGIVLCMFSLINLANSYSNKDWKKGINISVGPTWSNPGKTQTIFFTSSFPQTYVAATNSKTFGSGEIFVNLKKVIQSVTTEFGLVFAGTTSIPLTGDIWQDDDPDFNNFNYLYKIKHAHIGLRAKILKETSYRIQPYISASLAVGFNHAYHYYANPTIPEVSNEPPFTSRTYNAFTYTLDIGFHRSLNKNWGAEIGYEFSDWGKTNLGPAADQFATHGLSLNHVYTNALLLGLSFCA